MDCSTHPAHNQWVLPSGWNGLPAGTYRLNVNTNLGQNANHGAENLFSIWVSGSGRARVYGGGRMAAYTNLDDTGAGGTQKFYFSQIEAVHAGKTMVITLFDPGEASSDSYLRFLSPEGGTYHYATFNWCVERRPLRAAARRSRPLDSSGALFNNRILTIEIPLGLTTRPPPSTPTVSARTAGGRSSTTSAPATTRPPGRSRSGATRCTSSWSWYPSWRPGQG